MEIKEEAVRRGMEDIVVATLTAMLEWRKHNNKVSFWLAMLQTRCHSHMLATDMSIREGEGEGG